MHFFIQLIAELFWLYNLTLLWKYNKYEFWGEEINVESS